MKRGALALLFFGWTLAQGLLAGGQGHSLALLQGRLYAFGWNYDGQLGDGSFLNRSRPVRVLEGATAVAAGNLHSLVLLEGGRVLAFGAGEKGQLGDGTFATKGKPVELPLRVKGAAAGYSHTLLLGLDGRVHTTGSNEEGQLGDGSRRGRNQFAPVEGLPPVVGVAAGYFHSLAWTAGGELYAWGSNLSGQLGTGTVESSPRPQKVLTGVLLAVGGGSFTALLLRDGSVLIAGLDSATFRKVEGLPKAVSLAAGRAHLLVLGEDGRVYALGENDQGQLGDGTQEGRLEPRPVEGLAGVRAIGAGDAHSLAFLADGRLFAWGDNRFGQLGDGTRENRLTPVRVRLP